MTGVSNCFEFSRVTPSGERIGSPLYLSSYAGVVLNCPHQMKASEVRHLCEVARQSPGTPVDLVLWPNPDALPTWCAQITWIQEDEK